MNAHRSYRAGDTIEDHCRPCATDRLHTVVAADPVIAARLKANAGERARLRKSVRKIKNVSRREARA